MDEALTKPRNVTHTMYKLYNWLQMGMIDLNPEFQRDIVWTGIKQSHLVDSVLNNFYVPPIIFSCKKLDSKRWMRVCIDGKQRLTAIRKFMDNEIPHLSPSDGNITKRYYRNLNNRRSLTEAEREMFDCSELLCVEYYDLTLHQEQEIFSRVQLGVALTPAEKLQAISSPMADFAHTIYSQHSTLSSIMDNKRARPFQLITQSLHMIETEPEKFNATPATITKYLKEDREVPEGLKALAKQIYTTIEEMIEDDAELFHRDHRLAPVEFVFLTYMIAKYSKLPIFQYQNRLLTMKKHVRAKHDDIRFNNKVFDTLKKFVDNMEYEFISSNQTISYTPSSHNTNHNNHSNHSSHPNNSVTYPLQANPIYDTPVPSSSNARGKKRVKTSN